MSRPILSDNRFIVSLIVLIFLLSLAIPPVLVVTLGYQSYQARLTGTPVNETSFADLVSKNPDLVMFAVHPVIESVTAIHMSADYHGLETINETQAIAISLEFISRIPYLSEVELTIDDGWTILDNGKWRFKFDTINGTVFISVNAISGRITDFVDLINGSVQIQDVELTTSDLEQTVRNFMLEFNYTFSEHARYIGPRIVYDYSFHRDMYKLIFYNIVNGIYVEGNGVFFTLDPETGAVLGFGYDWAHVTDIPVENIISPEEAKSYVLTYLSNRSDMQSVGVTNALLIFDHTWSPLGLEYRLGWAVFVTSNPRGLSTVYIDAKSGIRYDLGGSATLSFVWTEENDVSLSSVFIVLMGSIALAGVTYVALRRHLLAQ